MSAVVQVWPAFWELAQTRSFEPPPLTNRPDCVIATIVFPYAKESGSTCVACWLPPVVNGLLLIGVAMIVSAPPLATTSSPAATATAAAQVLAPLNLSPPR